MHVDIHYYSSWCACSSVLLPPGSSGIYNSAMLLAFRMPFFPTNLTYNSLEATIVSHQSRYVLQSLHYLYYGTLSGIMLGFPSPLSQRPLQLLLGHCYFPRNSFSNISNFNFFTCANENYQLILVFSK